MIPPPPPADPPALPEYSLEALIDADGVGIVIGPISGIALVFIGVFFIFSRRAERGSLRTSGHGKELFGSPGDDDDLLDDDADSLMDEDDRDDLDDAELVDAVAEEGDVELLLGGEGAEESSESEDEKGARHEFLE